MLHTTLNDRYRVEAELGRGGTAIVYRAHDLLLDRAVAIKVLDAAGLGTTGRARLLAEARAAAKLSHPNIVDIHDVGEVDGAPFIVMELVEGETLRERPPAPLDETLALARQICAALEYAHAAGIIHRDLKLENVKVTPRGTAKLMDFGLARTPDAPRLTEEGALVGTAAYLAPELIQGQPATVQSDLYALGVMLYELTVGQPPFAGETLMALLSQHLTAPVTPPRELSPAIPAALDALILRLLSKRPDERPASPEVLAVLGGLATPTAYVAARPRHNLPAPLSSFIGREKEIAQLQRWLTPDGGGGVERRLVTLTGVGGTGKSRLALEVARACLPGYANGAWLAELAPLADPGLLPDTVAAALDIPPDPGRPALKVLTDYLRAKTLLLVLDNCEHLLDACASLAKPLLCECPQLRILATSREALGLAGETTLPVRSLAMPAAELSDLAALGACEAVQLFVDRAEAVRPDFELTESSAPHMAQICRRLDGIPLAIELAAARVRALSVEQIAARLDDRFRLLTGGSRTALPRHQTLRATMDWSYDLLAPRERTLLARLSVFAGGWTLEAAEAVGGDPDTIPPADVLDGLTHLIDKSLVLADEQVGETRYRMLETVRQYARDKLHESGEVEAVRGRHLDYFLQFTLAAWAEFFGPCQLTAMDRLDRELDNLRAALEWSLGPGRVEKGLRLVGGLGNFWGWRDKQQEAREWAERLLSQPEAAARTLARAYALLTACIDQTTGKQRAYLEEAVSIAREQGEAGRRLLAPSLRNLSLQVFRDDQRMAEAMLAEAVALARSLNDTWRVAACLDTQADFLVRKGDYSAARLISEEGLALCLANEDQLVAANFRFNLAVITYWQGDYAGAIQQCEQLVRHFRALKSRRRVAELLGGDLCDLERISGRYDVARAYALESLAIFRDLGVTVPNVFGNLVMIALRQGELDTAKRLLGERRTAIQAAGLAHGALSAFNCAAAIAQEKKARQAVVLLAFCRPYIQSDRPGITPADLDDYEHFLALARAQLDDAAFQAAWAEGSALTLEQALTLMEQETAAPRES